MSSPSEPSAGTARPDAGASDRIPTEIRLREIQNRLNDWREIRRSLTGDEDDDFPSDAELALDAHAADDVGWLLDTIAALRVALAEREADADRYAKLKARYCGADFEPFWAESGETDIALLFRFPSTARVGADLDAFIDSLTCPAAVAPAAREPAREERENV